MPPSTSNLYFVFFALKNPHGLLHTNASYTNGPSTTPLIERVTAYPLPRSLCQASLLCQGTACDSFRQRQSLLKPQVFRPQTSTRVSAFRKGPLVPSREKNDVGRRVCSVSGLDIGVDSNMARTEQPTTSRKPRKRRKISTMYWALRKLQ